MTGPHSGSILLGISTESDNEMRRRSGVPRAAVCLRRQDAAVDFGPVVTPTEAMSSRCRIRVGALGVLAVLSVAVSTAGCSKSHSASQPQPCGGHLRSASSAAAFLTTAARLSTMLDVIAKTHPTPRCYILHPLESSAVVEVGDTIEFVANTFPGGASSCQGGVMPLTRVGSDCDGFKVDIPAGSTPFTVRVVPGPSTSQNSPEPPTPHVIVSMTAVRPGTSTVSWFDCSGTGC